MTRFFFFLFLFALSACYPEREEDAPVEPAPDVPQNNENESLKTDAGPMRFTDAGHAPETRPPTDAGTVFSTAPVDAGAPLVSNDGGLACPPGFQLSSSETACVDVDECQTDNGGCAQECENVAGSFYCACSAGYVLLSDGVNCDDHDECATNNGGCDETCTNLEGSFECSCGGGRYLNEDGLTCQTQIETARSIAIEKGVGDIALSLDPDDIYEQGSYGDVTFLEAFRLALETFTTDGTDDYSPLQWVAYGGGDASDLVAYMNRSDTTIYLLPDRERLSPDAWYPPENGESIAEHWIFFMTGDVQLTALFWALVPRNGADPFNYGFD